MPDSSRRDRDRPRGFTLIELLVVIAVIGVLVALLLPGVQAAREAARGMQCRNNLKQLALAAHNYTDTVGCLPPGMTMGYSTVPGWLPLSYSFGAYASLLPYLEQRPLYNSVNFLVNTFDRPNSTVHATGIATLWCPSDPVVSQSQTIATWPDGPKVFTYTSYAGSSGPWNIHGAPAPSSAALDQNLGLFYQLSAVRFGRITDGLSQTIVFGEKAHGLLSPQDTPWFHWWPSGWPQDTMFTTWYGINPHRRFAASPFVGWATLISASSFHPGGAHVAMMDGSVRFLKDTIDTWPVDPQTGETGAYWDDVRQRMAFRPESRFGVYQALSTRNGSEVISADAY